MADDTDLRFRQAAGTLVETTLKQILFEFPGCADMAVKDVLFIARTARSVAFDAFTKPTSN